MSARQGHRRLGVAALALGIVAISSQSEAAPVVSRYPGQMCVIHGSEQSTYGAYLQADSYGRSCNTHGSHDITVTCPIPKNEWDANDSEFYGNAWSVSVTKKGSGSFSWDCTAYSRDTEGDAYWYDDAASVSYSGADLWGWYANFMSVNRHHRYGYTHFRCVVPAGECLAGYTVSHVDGTCSGSGDC